MRKHYLYLLIIIFGALILNKPIRSYINNTFSGDSLQRQEESTIGTVIGYNARVEEIQKILKESNLYTGPIDGLMGARTRSAIKSFQTDKRLWPSGRVDSKTWATLNRENLTRQKETVVYSSTPIPKKRTRDISSKTVATSTSEIESKMTALPKDRQRQIQLALKKASFYKGAIDGKIGPRTKKALREFQNAKGLKVDGVVGVKTWAELSNYLEEFMPLNK